MDSLRYLAGVDKLRPRSADSKHPVSLTMRIAELECSELTKTSRVVNTSEM